tara:strand:- start:6 stop:833 length:828 start_codon:yes stop_codon:yes gene_type:complete
MKKLFFVLFIFCASMLVAQNKSYNYSGFIQLVDDSKIPYQLKFTIEQNRLSGYSISDSFGLDETRSTIVGSVKGVDFLINEIDIMSSRSTFLENEFCLLQMNLQLIEENKIRYLKGDFNGYYSDSVACVNGVILLIDSLSYIAISEPLFARKQSKRNKDVSVKTLTKNSGLSFQTKKEEVTFYIWDNGKVDDDRITIGNNGILIVEDYSVKKKRKKIKIALNTGINTISIKALNVGAFAPNTTRIQIQGEGQKYEAVTFLKQGEEAVIKIKRITD